MEVPVPYNAGGRPPKEPENKRSAVIKCYLTPAEKADIKTKCDYADMSASDFLRDLALRKEISIKANPAELKKIRAELGKIGGNINQIAKAVNSGEEFDEARFKKLAAWLVHTIDQL